nr:MAG TPA: Protein of unknown function (DUF3895) [Caudoviricetes sp.]
MFFSAKQPKIYIDIMFYMAVATESNQTRYGKLQRIREI